MTIPRILSIAGSDSGGGAGIQADIKTITMLGGQAMTAITAITAQNTMGVRAVSPVPTEMITQQIAAVIDDIGVDAIKIGMLGMAEAVRAVSNALMLASRKESARVPIVLDPVMLAKGGARLLSSDALSAMTERLFPISALVTPNAPELAALAGRDVRTEAEAHIAAQCLATEYHCTVLAKGGHLEGDEVVDLLVDHSGILARWADPRIDTKHTHGTGCTLSSAIAVGLGEGRDMTDAIGRARSFVRAAMHAAPGLGAGQGPMGHALGAVPFDRMG